jgi:uncharacterized protein (DUF885 family)
MSACRISRQWLVARCAARCRHGRLLKRLDARTGAQVYARLHRDPEHEIETEVDRYIAWRGQALSYYMGELAIVRQLCLALHRISSAPAALDRYLAALPAMSLTPIAPFA